MAFGNISNGEQISVLTKQSWLVMTGNAQRLGKRNEKHIYGSSDPTFCEGGPSTSKQPMISEFVVATNNTQQQKFDK